MVENDLQITSIRMGGIGLGFAITPMLSLYPPIDGVLNIEQGPCMRATPHCAVGKTECEGDGVGETAIGEIGRAHV